MNKYEEELLKHISDDSIVYELRRDLVRESKVAVLDFFLDNFFSLLEGIKELRRAKAYFLIIDGQDARLVEIGKDLTALSYDLTDKTVLKEGNNYFNFEGKRYILVKKIQ